VGSTGSSSVLTGAAGTFVARAGIALGHEPAHARLAPCGEQGVRALGPQPIGLREAAVEVLEIPQTGQRGRLMDDRFGPGLEDGLAHSMRIEQVQLDRPGTQRAQAFRIPGRLERADHLMPSLNQLRDEAATYGAARSRNKHSHLFLLLAISVTRRVFQRREAGLQRLDLAGLLV
jgi:hypothetical protein